jgi:magnesium-transporting ATPase (P-type)
MEEADDVIHEKLNPQSPYRQEIQHHAKHFDNDDLRTLCCPYRIFDEQAYSSWSARYRESCCEIHDREEKINRFSAEIEKDLNIIGVTGIEDKFQRDIPKTIKDLLKA